MLKKTALIGISILSQTLSVNAVGKSFTQEKEHLVSLNDIQIELFMNSKADGTLSPMVRISNTSNSPVVMADPGGRLALLFVVMDSLGNVVAPTGRAKIDPKATSITIEPHKHVDYSREKLEFISGTALFGYDLKNGATYRVVAVYRPNGFEHEGVSSREVVINVK